MARLIMTESPDDESMQENHETQYPTFGPMQAPRLATRLFPDRPALTPEMALLGDELVH